jgi:AcrR family transcriptional regulator
MPRGARPNLTLTQVLDAAAAVLQRDGHGGLTMRAVAAELGVQAPAIYWYVKDKQALELALYDHLQDALVFEPKGDDWREDMRAMAEVLRAFLLAHRDVALLVPNHFFFAPRSMARLDLVLGVLIRGGLSPRDAAYAFSTGYSYVLNWSRGEAELRAHPTEERPGLDEAAKAYIASGALPNVAAAFAAFAEPGALDEQFRFGFDALIAGFERLARKS